MAPARFVLQVIHVRFNGLTVAKINPSSQSVSNYSRLPGGLQKVVFVSLVRLQNLYHLLRCICDSQDLPGYNIHKGGGYEAIKLDY